MKPEFRIILDLKNPDIAYLIGLAQTDGNLYAGVGEKGRFTLEISERDESILYELQKIIPVYSSITHRTRTTNFSKCAKSASLCVSNRYYREALVESGITYGKKSTTIAPPKVPFSKPNYFRGVIDGDGSLGITGNGFPFLSLVTASQELATVYLEFITEITGITKSPKRNNRDGVFNIVLYKEQAQQLAKALYSHGGLSIRRKQDKFVQLMQWTRPTNMRIILEQRTWTTNEDEVVKNNKPEIAAGLLNRSLSSVKNRKFRLKETHRHYSPRPSSSTVRTPIF